MSAVTYDRAQRGLAPIFPPKRAEVAGLWEALQPTSSFCVRLLVAGRELGQVERPRGEKWSRDWLESLCPPLGPQILTLRKPQPGIPAKSRRVRRLGRSGLQAGFGRETQRASGACGPNTPSLGRCLAWRLPGTQTRGLFDPRPALSGATSFIFFYCSFCPIGYRSVLHPVWFSHWRMPRLSLEPVCALLLKEWLGGKCISPSLF